MTSNLPDDLRQEVLDHPCQATPFVDEQSGKTFYICDEEFLLFGADKSDQARQQLRALIDEGLASPAVPQEEAEARIRAKMKAIADRNA